MNLFGNRVIKCNICVRIRGALKIQTLLIMYKSNRVFIKEGIVLRVLTFDLNKIIPPVLSVFKTFFYLLQSRRLDPCRRMTNGLVNGLLSGVVFNFENSKKWMRAKFVKYDGCGYFWYMF